MSSDPDLSTPDLVGQAFEERYLQYEQPARDGQLRMRGLFAGGIC